MKKTLFYTVQKELTSVGDIEETTGFKIVNVYEILDNKPKLFVLLDLENSDNTIDSIKDWLNDNGYGYDEFEFINL